MENKTLFDKIKEMSLDELATFLAYNYKHDMIAMADRYICRKCKAKHGGCPITDDEPCLYDLSDQETIKLWLEGEVDGREEG